MRENVFSLTCILSYKDRNYDSISENPYSRIFYAVGLLNAAQCYAKDHDSLRISKIMVSLMIYNYFLHVTDFTSMI